MGEREDFQEACNSFSKSSLKWSFSCFCDKFLCHVIDQPHPSAQSEQVTPDKEGFFFFPTNNALLINFRLSSDAEILLISTDRAYKSAPNMQKCVCIPTELPFYIPPLVVGFFLLSPKLGRSVGSFLFSLGGRFVSRSTRREKKLVFCGGGGGGRLRPHPISRREILKDGEEIHTNMFERRRKKGESVSLTLENFFLPLKSRFIITAAPPEAPQEQ